jgi:hypothetical protein
MKHLKSANEFFSNKKVNEELIGWLKDKFKAGVEYGENYLEKEPEEIERIQQELREYKDQSAVMRLNNWVKSLIGKSEEEVADELKEVELNESSENLLKKISRISGSAIGLLTIFGSIITAMVGLYQQNGFLFVIGAVVAIISTSIAGAFGDNY